ncbi:MAG: hypothetical protein HYV63_16800 [Candidatus Schekmanbacteria bacterium]|nr:hypothetical protein [Candidatus Schekmanbacteria bacterium]
MTARRHGCESGSPHAGKQIRGALYLHRDAVPALDDERRRAIATAGEIAGAGPATGMS